MGNAIASHAAPSDSSGISAAAIGAEGHAQSTTTGDASMMSSSEQNRHDVRDGFRSTLAQDDHCVGLDKLPAVHADDSDGLAHLATMLFEFCKITGADTEIARHYVDGLSLEAALSLYYENEPQQASDAHLVDILDANIAEQNTPDDVLSASELRARAQACQDISEEDLGWIAYSNLNVMPSNRATWSWGKDSWTLNMRRGVVTESSFVPYIPDDAAEIEERFSAWKQNVAPSTCTLLVHGVGTTALGQRLSSSKSRQVSIDFETMMQMDMLTGQQRPIKRC